MILGQDRPSRNSWRPGAAARCTTPGCWPVRAASARRVSPGPRRGACWPKPPGRARRPGLDTPPTHPIAQLIEAGSHPDMRCSSGSRTRPAMPRAQHQCRPGARAGRVHVRMTPAMSPIGARWSSIPSTISKPRPPTPCSRCSRSRRPTCLFFLVSHAPGPTCCRRSARAAEGWIFSRLTMTSWRRSWPGRGIDGAKIADARRQAGGSAGKALASAALDLGKLRGARRWRSCATATRPTRAARNWPQSTRRARLPPNATPPSSISCRR